MLDAVGKAGAGFRSLADNWAVTTPPHGRLTVTVLGGLAEFERELIKARTAEGRIRAKARGVRLGRKLKLSRHQILEALARREAGEALTEIGVGRVEPTASQKVCHASSGSPLSARVSWALGRARYCLGGRNDPKSCNCCSGVFYVGRIGQRDGSDEKPPHEALAHDGYVRKWPGHSAMCMRFQCSRPADVQTPNVQGRPVVPHHDRCLHPVATRGGLAIKVLQGASPVGSHLYSRIAFLLAHRRKRNIGHDAARQRQMVRRRRKSLSGALG